MLFCGFSLGFLLLTLGFALLQVLFGRPVEIMFPYKADALDCIGLTERVLIHGVGVGFETQFAILGKHYLRIEVAEERLVGDIIVAVAHITVDNQTAATGIVLRIPE